MHSFYHALKEVLASRQPCVVVTVVSTEGSTPRKTSSKMIVGEKGELVWGTIGGGAIEHFVLKRAKKCIENHSPELVDYNVGSETESESQESTGMACGGVMKLFFDPIGIEPEVVIIGGGHIGQMLCSILSQCEFQCIIADEREEFTTNERHPSAIKTITASFPRLTDELPINSKSYVVIVTHSHERDEDVLKCVIKKPFHYLGMIGSKSKVKEIFSRLLDAGISNEELKKVHSPIGIPIGSKTPAEIAISIAAELIKFRNGNKENRTN